MGWPTEAYGNLFGALAFTPGSQETGDDDGFLTLAEIYELPLAGTELAILSACDTNYGPEQKGEGIWSLSRGFPGCRAARRVVASNWLVDDEAGASLVSVYCGQVAKGQQSEARPIMRRPPCKPPSAGCATRTSGRVLITGARSS